MFSDSDIEAVLAATDLVTLVNQYLARPGLRKSGVQMVGYCCFHQERTPSFYVHPGKQFYHCKGCGAGGNAINFLIAADRISFPEAVRSLAARAGVTLSDQSPNPQRDAYATMIAAEAAWFWEQVARAYRTRYMRQGRAATDVKHYRDHNEDCWELLCLQVRITRSWKRWGRIISRLDRTPRNILVEKYYRIRTLHPEVVRMYREERDLDAACNTIFSQASVLVANLSTDKFNGFIESIAKHFV